MLGFGTYMLKGKAAASAVEYAINIGYRHIDRAKFYENEKWVGKAIKNSKIDRKQLFITTKLDWYGGHETGRGEVANRVKESLSHLGLDYIDLYVIHSPTHMF